MTEPSERFSLSRFLAQHHKELAGLGAFSALAGLAGGLPIGLAQQLLMLVMVALALTLWLEVSRLFPQEPAGFLLYLFQALMWLAMLALVAFWVITLAKTCSVGSKTAALFIAIPLGSLTYAFLRRCVRRPAFLRKTTLKFDPVAIIVFAILAVAVAVLALATAQPAAEAATAALPRVREAMSMGLSYCEPLP